MGCATGAESTMSYYIGFRHGWVRLFGRMVCWHDAAFYPNFGKGYQVGVWKVWVS